MKKGCTVVTISNLNVKIIRKKTYKSKDDNQLLDETHSCRITSFILRLTFALSGLLIILLDFSSHLDLKEHFRGRQFD